MSKYEIKPNTGSVFRNKEKKSDTHADYTGRAMIDGVEYYANAWINTSQKTGEKYMSIKYKPVQEVANQYVEQAKQSMKPQPSQDIGDFSDDIPF